VALRFTPEVEDLNRSGGHFEVCRRRNYLESESSTWSIEMAVSYTTSGDTIAIDVCSRRLTGFYLLMDAPSRLSTSLCLLHSVLDKSPWLREREIIEPWPVAGLPDTLHVDNILYSELSAILAAGRYRIGSADAFEL
jgi:transposase InsO family protein